MPLIPVSPGISQSGENPLAWTDDLRGINGMVSATRATSTGVKVMRGSPGITWTRVGNSMRYHPTVGYTAFDATLNSLANADPEIRVIIDPHEDFPGFPRTDTSHADNPFWFYPDCQANAVELWTDIANHYKNWGTIIGGYDLVNEPTCPYWNANSSRYPEVFTTASAAAAPAAGVTWSQLMDAWDLVGWTYSTTVPAYTVDQPDPRSWNKLCRRCAEAIRATGDMHPIVISLSNRGGTNPADPDTPTDGGTGINMGTFQRAKDVPNEFVDMSEFEDIVYTVHSYGPETANNSTDPPRIVPWQTNGWNQDPAPAGNCCKPTCKSSSTGPPPIRRSKSTSAKWGRASTSWTRIPSLRTSSICSAVAVGPGACICCATTTRRAHSTWRATRTCLKCARRTGTSWSRPWP